MAMVVTEGFRVVNRDLALSAGRAAADLRRLDEASAAFLSTQAIVDYRAAWTEEDLGDGWVAAYRIAIQDGAPVVAEVRVFPDVWKDGRRPPGIWAGEYVGFVQAVPPGGLRAAVHRRVTLARPVKDALARLSRIEEAFPGALGKALPVEPERRTRVDDAVLARVANAYVMAGYSVRSVAKQLNASETTIRGRVMLARRRGLLTASGKSGVRAGKLTPAAKKLLSTRRRTR